MPSSSPQDFTRRHDLDWIRVGAFFLLILYHVGMFYVPWEWHVKSPSPVPALEPVMLLTNPWRLTLLFVVSGAATRFMADKLGAARLTGARVGRLLPPLLFAMFVVVPPQAYYQIAEYVAAHPQASFGVDPWPVFWIKYATASGRWCGETGECLTTPTWNHMWFVAYLLVYTLLLAALLAVVPRLGHRLQAACERLLDGPWLLVAPIVWLALTRTFLLPRFEITHALVDDWYNHSISLAAFLLGFGLAKSATLRQRLVSMRWPALALAICAYAAFASYAWIHREVEPAAALRVAMRWVYAADQWSFIVAILGFGAKHLNRDGPVLRYLSVGVFPFYLVHQTATVVLAHHLAKLGLPQAFEAAILIAGTFATCFAVYELARRVPVARVLFGLKP